MWVRWRRAATASALRNQAHLIDLALLEDFLSFD
jgi:hypothetical protein